jgi:hypothetical protein
MHSKVYYAEARDECWLWVGSHNLTARAIAGANLEAAILLAGHPLEAPFQAARQHIEQCRQESSLCPIESPPIPDGENVDTVIIHADCDDLPAGPPQWHVLLGLRSAKFDWLLRPVAEVRLYLYRRGELALGWKRAVPWTSYAGTLTGLNFTEVHPETPGIPATWSDEDYSIIEARDVLYFSKTPLGGAGIVTQAMINIESLARPNEAFLPARPKAGWDEQTERHVVGRADADLSDFFTKASIQNGRLLYEIRRHGEGNWRVSLSDLREPDQRKLQEAAEDQHVLLVDVYEEKRARHPLIMRAKYQLRGQDSP